MEQGNNETRLKGRLQDDGMVENSKVVQVNIKTIAVCTVAENFILRNDWKVEQLKNEMDRAY